MISHLRHLRAPPCISELRPLGAPPSMISQLRHLGMPPSVISQLHHHDLTTAPPRGATMISHLRHLRAPPCISQLHHLRAPPSMISQLRHLGGPPSVISQLRHLGAPPWSHNCATSGRHHDFTTAPPPGAVVISTTASPQGTTAITAVPYHHDHLDPATIGSRWTPTGGHWDPDIKGLPPFCPFLLPSPWRPSISPLTASTPRIQWTCTLYHFQKLRPGAF